VVEEARIIWKSGNEVGDGSEVKVRVRRREEKEKG